MNNKKAMRIVNQSFLLNKIYVIRGQKVMLDFELAEIYGYETKISIDKSKIILKNLTKILCFN